MDAKSDRGGTRKWVLEMGQFILDDNGKPEAMEGLVIDISGQKRRRRRCNTWTDTISLRGFIIAIASIRKRRGWKPKACTPLTVAICDINGVRLVNNGFGAAEGDRLIADVAQMLKQNFRQRDILCRTGGDELRCCCPIRESRPPRCWSSYSTAWSNTTGATAPITTD